MLIISSLLAVAAAASPIHLPGNLQSDLKTFEPSGALYAEDLGLFLVASDDTTEDDGAMLFLMDDQGRVEAQPLEIEGVKKMTDIESISEDLSGRLFVMSSLGLNKKGKFKPERNLFVMAERNGQSIQAIEKMDLRTPLLEAIENSSVSEVRDIVRVAEEELDVESHYIANGEVIVGIKNPQPNPGEALVFNLGNVDDVFNSGAAEIGDVLILDFTSFTGENDQLSEMLPVGDAILMTTTIEGGTGRLWKYVPSTNELNLVEEFPRLTSEGLAYRPSSNDLLIVFDLGSIDAQFVVRSAP